jgi:signal transduction histidine kinase/ActR/RegA family two-component response regulator
VSLRPNLKIKFTLAICCLLALSTFTLGWLFLVQVEESALERLQEKGAIVARGLAERAELGVFTHNADLLEVALAPADTDADVVYAGVADEAGVVLAQHRAPEVSRVPAWARDERGATGVAGGSRLVSDASGPGDLRVYYVTVPIRVDAGAGFGEKLGVLPEEKARAPGRGRVGSVCIGVSAAAVAREMRGLRRGLMLATLAVLVAGVAIAVWLVRVIVEPVKQLAHATERIAAGDLDVQLPRPGGDEIGALASSFNRMTLNLKESRQALEHSNAELEMKVRVRTRALEETQHQLIQAEKMTVVGQLVSGVAHELNNPLAGVLGYAQLMLRRGVSEEVARGLKKIEGEAERCRRIVQNLLIFARKHKAQKSLLDLNAVIDSTLELRAYQLKVDNITVVRDLDPGLPRTMADMHQMQQVLMNMINNAQHAMSGSVRPRQLILRSRHGGGRISIQVADNGAGIVPENLGRIFDPFFTTKEVGHGTGLGLSICYGIVQEHRGDIRVESTPGVGTTFTLDLPVVQQAGGVEDRSESLQEAMGGAATRKGRILLVDDERSILDILGDVLRMDGHEVETTNNGAAALGRLKQERFDVVVSDLKMPGMSGRELFERLERIDAALSRRLIFTTGDLASPETLSFLERTGNPYLQKPFDLNAVRRMVQAMLASG